MSDHAPQGATSPPTCSAAQSPPGPCAVHTSERLLHALRVAHGPALDLPEMRGPLALLTAGKVSLAEFLVAWDLALETRVWPEIWKAAYGVCRRYGRFPSDPQAFEDHLREVTDEAFLRFHEHPYNPTRWPLPEYYYQALAQMGFDALRGGDTVRLTRTRPNPADPSAEPIKERVRVSRFQPLPDHFDRPAPAGVPLTEDEFRELLARLPLDRAEREMLESIYERGQTLAEFAAAQDKSAGTVRRQHARLLERLRAALAEFMRPSG